MTTTTPKQPHTSSQPDDDQVQETVDRYISACEAADALLMRLAKGEELTPGGISLLRSVGIEDRPEIDRHVARLSRIAKRQEIVGSSADREKLAKQIEKAKAELDSKVPEIRAELEATVQRLQGQIDKLEAAYSVPARKMEVIEQELEHLRNVRSLPQFVQDRYNVLKTNLRSTIKVDQAKSTATALSGRLSLVEQAKTQPNVTRVGNRNLFEFLDMNKLWQAGEHGAVVGKVDSTALAVLEKQLKAELAETQAYIDQHAEEYEGRMAAVEEARNYYIPE